MNVKFGTQSLNDGTTYFVTETDYRSFGSRPLDSELLTRRPGAKFYYTDFGPKVLRFNGYIVGTTASGLQGAIDTLQNSLRQKEQALVIGDDIYGTRSYTATVSQLSIPNQNYNQTYLPYSVEFTANDPFSYGLGLTASGSVVSGTVTYSGSTTISGTVFAEPTFTLYPTSLAAGNSGINAFQIGYTTTGETLTASGVFNYTSPVSFNYSNFTVTNSGINADFNGSFSRWEPGSTNFTITTSSGLHNSYNWVLSYQPRYLS